MGTVLLVDDDRTIRHIVSKAFGQTHHQVIAAQHVEDGLRIIRDHSPDVVLLDIELPEITGFEAFDKIKALDSKLPVVYITGGGTSDTAIEAMKLGAFDYLLKPLDLRKVRDVVESAMDIRKLMNEPVAIRSAISPEDHGDQIVGRSPEMQEVFKAIGRVAPQDVTVLIRGESGTGKELVARAIYQHSLRKDQPFLTVNCAAIPEHLLESELFGHEKGAFTGAEQRRIGKFEQCHGGTLFLDEIGDMPPLLQSKILRLLQQKEFQRVGGNETIRVDVRIVAATNRHLEQMVADGDYREDLLYRLNGYCISLPALRDRGDDLNLLIEHFLSRISRSLNRSIDGVSNEALEILRAYRWPGNIRELEGVVRHSVLQTNGTIIAAEFLPQPIKTTIGKAEIVRGSNDLNLDSSSVSEPPSDLRAFISQQLTNQSANLYAETLELMERYLLAEVLRVADGNQSEAARILGITRGSLRHKIRSLGITIESKIDAGDA
ncbi:MAG: sigma-54-dependent Fis family transcriptional regulator [Planctomycetales bacterium]|nr:sigma-54-dependent Fis family transcriptional regulator [Planctomycetales bacterium]